MANTLKKTGIKPPEENTLPITFRASLTNIKKECGDLVWRGTHIIYARRSIEEPERRPREVFDFESPAYFGKNASYNEDEDAKSLLIYALVAKRYGSSAGSIRGTLHMIARILACSRKSEQVKEDFKSKLSEIRTFYNNNNTHRTFFKAYVDLMNEGRVKENKFFRDVYQTIAQCRPSFIHGEFRPLSDAFISEFGARAHWMKTVLAPYILRFLELAKETLEPLDLSQVPVNMQSYAFSERRNTVVRLFKNYENEYPCPTRTVDFPISHRYRTYNEGSRGAQAKLGFDPTQPDCLVQLIDWIQTSHAFYIFLTTGCRDSEFHALTINSLKKISTSSASQGEYYINSATFKNNTSDTGENRQWPVCKFVADCIIQQRNLQGYVDHLFWPKNWPWCADRDSLFFSLQTIFRRDPKNQFFDANKALQRATEDWKCEIFFQTANEDQRGIHTHRFRKTLARLYVLSQYKSVFLLNRLFGHLDAESTFHYMFTSGIIAEITEQRILMSESAKSVASMNTTDVEKDQALNFVSLIKELDADIEEATIEFNRELVMEVIDERSVWSGKGADSIRLLHKQSANAIARTDSSFLDTFVKDGADKRIMLLSESKACTSRADQIGKCSVIGNGRKDPTACQPDCDFRMTKNDEKTVATAQTAAIKWLNHLASDWRGRGTTSSNFIKCRKTSVELDKVERTFPNMVADLKSVTTLSKGFKAHAEIQALIKEIEAKGNV